MKTYTQLREVANLLLTDNNTIKPFDTFSQQAMPLFKRYNEQYLQAEYQYAIAAAQSCANWANITTDAILQYRTAGDSRVRDEHQPLHNTTLPASSAFWNNYYPPNGWRCRCIAIEVNADKQRLTDEQTAIKQGETATTKLDKNGKNTLEIFRFNPGKQQVIFPPNHPYTYGKHCNTQLSQNNQDDKCNALKIIHQMAGDNYTLKQQRKEIKQWAKENLVGKTIKHPDIDKDIRFTVTGIKEALNQPHKDILAKNELVKNIDELIKNSKLETKATDYEGKVFYYLKLQQLKGSYIVIKEEEGVNSFYSIVDKIKKRQ